MRFMFASSFSVLASVFLSLLHPAATLHSGSSTCYASHPHARVLCPIALRHMSLKLMSISPLWLAFWYCNLHSSSILLHIHLIKLSIYLVMFMFSVFLYFYITCTSFCYSSSAFFPWKWLPFCAESPEKMETWRKGVGSFDKWQRLMIGR